MPGSKLISAEELSKYGPVNTLNERALTLVKQQQKVWKLAAKNFAALADVQTRVLDFGHFNIEVHHNPARLGSSAALTDPQSLAQRLCFLCTENMTPEQNGIAFRDNYLIFTNPFPIFSAHLTIPLIEHIPQRLEHYFPDMLDLSSQLSGFTIFYNGPRCGASAPDHFHFQAVSGGLLPVEKEFYLLKEKHSKVVFNKNNLEIVAVEDYLRPFLSVVSKDKDAIIQSFSRFYTSFVQEDGEEPMINVLSNYRDGFWRIIIFPRKRQRPSHFFREGKNQIVIGPATVEMAGILILPRYEDFNLIDHKTVSEIYSEVAVSSDSFDHMIDTLMGCC